MDFQITEDRKVVTFFLRNPKRKKACEVYLQYETTKLTTSEIRRLCVALRLQNQSLKFGSQRNAIYHVLKPWLTFISERETELPCTSNGWQILVLEFFEFYLTNTSYARTDSTTRVSRWAGRVRNTLLYWIDEEIIPIDVFIPEVRTKKIQTMAADQSLLGNVSDSKVKIENKPTKLVIALDFSMSDADYLNSVETKCQKVINLIKDICLRHWENLMEDGEMGKKLADTIDLRELDERKLPLNRNRYIPRPCSAAAPQGFRYAIAFIRNSLLSGQTEDCISTSTIRRSALFTKDTFLKTNYRAALAPLSKMGERAFSQLSYSTQLYRFVGVLSGMDVSAVCCLLTIEHPEFTSEMFKYAKLVNARGKYQLIMTDADGSFLLSLDKPRAHQRKIVTLTPLANKLISDVIRWTEAPRNVLRRSGDIAWRYLFIGLKIGSRLGPVEYAARHLNSSSTTGLTRLYPELTEVGLESGTFDYRRIRTTMGVLKWFETGSIVEMARRLGNSYRVSMEHYLPPVLLEAWNARIIRRFQNMLLVVAASDQEYLLEVTDFSTISDLQHFIAQLIFDYPEDASPLSKELHRRIAQSPFGQASTPKSHNLTGLLNIRLSPDSLACLYAFSDFASSNMNTEELNRVDMLSKLAPCQFVDLSHLIRHACETDTIADELRELIDLSRLQSVHHQAIVKLPKLVERFSRLTVVGNWS